MLCLHRSIVALSFACYGAALLSANQAWGQETSKGAVLAPVPAAPAPTVTLSIVARARNKSEAMAPGAILITPRDEKKTVFDVHANSVRFLDVIEALAKQAGKTLIIADEVRRHFEMLSPASTPKVGMDFLEIPANDLFAQLAGAMNCSWGKIGENTWLLTYNFVQERARLAQTPVITAPLLPVPQPNYPFNLNPRDSRKGKLPPDATPFEFNGGTYYHVPLEK